MSLKDLARRISKLRDLNLDLPLSPNNVPSILDSLAVIHWYVFSFFSICCRCLHDPQDGVDPNSIVRLLGTAGLTVLLDLMVIDEPDWPILKVVRKLSVLIFGSLVSTEPEDETVTKETVAHLFSQPFSERAPFLLLNLNTYLEN